MNVLDTMEQTLQTNGQTGLMPMSPPRPRRMRWPKEFRDPIDAAMTFDTSKPLPQSRRPKKVPPTEHFYFFG